MGVDAVRYLAMSIPAGVVIVYAVYDARMWSMRAKRIERAAKRGMDFAVVSYEALSPY